MKNRTVQNMQLNLFSNKCKFHNTLLSGTKIKAQFGMCICYIHCWSWTDFMSVFAPLRTCWGEQYFMEMEKSAQKSSKILENLTKNLSPIFERDRRTYVAKSSTSPIDAYESSNDWCCMEVALKRHGNLYLPLQQIVKKLPFHKLRLMFPNKFSFRLVGAAQKPLSDKTAKCSCSSISRQKRTFL